MNVNVYIYIHIHIYIYIYMYVFTNGIPTTKALLGPPEPRPNLTNRRTFDGIPAERAEDEAFWSTLCFVLARGPKDHMS